MQQHQQKWVVQSQSRSASRALSSCVVLVVVRVLVLVLLLLLLLLRLLVVERRLELIASGCILRVGAAGMLQHY